MCLSAEPLGQASDEAAAPPLELGLVAGTDQRDDAHRPVAGQQGAHDLAAEEAGGSGDERCRFRTSHGEPSEKLVAVALFVLRTLTHISSSLESGRVSAS